MTATWSFKVIRPVSLIQGGIASTPFSSWHRVYGENNVSNVGVLVLGHNILQRMIRLADVVVK